MRYKFLGALFTAITVGWGALIGVTQDQGSDMIRQAEKLAKERVELEQKLIAVAQSTARDKEAMARRKAAVEALGQIGSKRSVPVLITLIDEAFDGNDYADHGEGGRIPPTPAMKALATLEAVAVEDLVEALTKKEYPIAMRYREQALEMLPCKDLVKAVIAERIRRENDAELKGRLKSSYISVFGETLKDEGKPQKREK